MKGYRGTLLRINLQTRVNDTQDVDPTTAEQFIGGKGIGAAILKDENTKVSPLSPNNLLLFGTGPLTGTPAPTSGRWVVVTKSPLTNLFLDSHVGGSFGAEIKKAGYDFLIINGKADKPVYLTITNDKVQFHDAKKLWGKGSFAVEEYLYQKHKGKTVSIGPAGENQVLFACINTGTHGHHGRAGHAGRGGAGAVMGSKNLKAIVIKGTQEISYADSHAFSDAVKKARHTIRNNTFIPLRRKYGTPYWVHPVNEAGLLPTRNFTTGSFEEVSSITGESMHESIVVKNTSCFNCPIACGKLSTVNYANHHFTYDGPEYETIALLGSNCGNGDLNAIAYLNYLCDDYGLDTISTGNILAFASECSHKGLLNVDIDFSRPDKQARLIKKISLREGIGDLLAEGVYRVSKKIDAHQYALHCKGMEFPGYDPRGAFGMALAYATSDRGACHQRAWTVNAELKGELSPRFSIEGRASWVKEVQDERAAFFSLILCDFAPLDVAQSISLLNTATGFEYTPKSYLTTGERIWNLIRLYNIREGSSPDSLPPRMHIPLPDNEQKVITTEMFTIMLQDYYKERQWDSQGHPTHKKLAELGL